MRRLQRLGGETRPAEVLGTCSSEGHPVLALPVPEPGWGRCSHFRSWGYGVSCSPLLPKSEKRENSLEGCYGNRSPWRAQPACHKPFAFGHALT